MLVYLSETVRLMILHDEDYETVSKYITGMNDYIFANEKLKKYSTGIYGFFDVFGGKFHDGTGWVPPSDYTPVARPWYRAAIEANGKTAVTEPYMGVAMDVYTLTFARRIFGKDGKPLGIICLDIILDMVRELTVNTRFAHNGYGILLNSNLEILAHPDKKMYGKKMVDINISLLPIVKDLERGIPVLEHRVKNYKGEPSVLFFRQIENGWYIAVMISEAAYFKEMRIMRLAVIALGAILTVLFIGMVKKLTITNEKLEALSTTDELTKLNNRRSFLEYVNLIWKQNRRLNLPVTILMIDIDYFKKYNDSLGHLEGDKALIAIAKCLKDSIKRETDFVARFGGEEFVCVLPFIEKAEAFEFTKTMVQSVEDMKIPHPMNLCSKYLTISVGMASAVPNSDSSHVQLLDEADKALYSAKASGRNRVVMS